MWLFIFLIKFLKIIDFSKNTHYDMNYSKPIELVGIDYWKIY